MSEAAALAWKNALLAAAVHAVSPKSTGGIWLKAPAGPVRDRWLAEFRSLLDPKTPFRRMPASIADDRLLGGLDLAATLQADRPIAEKGLLAQAHEGFIVLAMAERLDAATAAKLAGVMDQGMVTTERDGLAFLSPARFGVIALDEGIDDEEPPKALTERLGLIVDLRPLSHRDLQTSSSSAEHVRAAKSRLAVVEVHDEAVMALCAVSAALGVDSLRTGIQATQVSRAIAALDGRSILSDDDVVAAAILVLSPRATQIPQTADLPENSGDKADDEAEPTPHDHQNSGEQDKGQPHPLPLEDVVLDAAHASIPPDLLEALKLAAEKALARTPGKSGQIQKQSMRGRIIGSRPGNFKGRAKLDVIATLRAAAPWQNLRRQHAPTASRILVRNDDLRISTYRQRSQTCTIFVVDASGSSALQRLAEAKGAIRLLLAECYVRRDEVALIAFRGTAAEILMPPTRALVRAQRALAALPGGGGTPIATGIDAAVDMASLVQREGHTATLVFMTDGRANVCRDGSSGREKAQEEARTAARSLKALRIQTILIDTSPKPQQLAAELAASMQARYVPLPQANAQRLAQTVTLLQKPFDKSTDRRGAA